MSPWDSIDVWRDEDGIGTRNGFSHPLITQIEAQVIDIQAPHAAFVWAGRMPALAEMCAIEVVTSLLNALGELPRYHVSHTAALANATGTGRATT